jgi:anti-sigma B factor antagonist
MLDFANVPYVDSAGIGALVGAYVTHQKDGRSLYLIGVRQRVKDALKVTHVQEFFRFVDSVAAAEQASSA